MKILGFLITIMFSILIGNTMAYGIGHPDLAYVITPILFGGSLLVPNEIGMLATYITVDVKKEAKSTPGYEPPKDQIIIIRARDVSFFPSRDSKGVKITDNIQLVDGANMMRLDITAGTAVYKGTAEGDSDSRAIKQSIEAEVPGYGLAIAEFMANNFNEDLYAILDFCDGSTSKLFGSPCAKMQMKPDFEGNKDKTYSKIVLESANKGPVIALYEGTKTFATDFQIAADDATPSIAEGEGRYVIPSDNAAAVSITSLDDAVAGTVVTLVGSGGANLSTISSGGEFILENGAAWSSENGATITFEVFDDTHFIEKSRTV